MKRIIIWDSDEIYDEDEEDNEDSDKINNEEAEITNEDGQKIRVKLPNSQKIIHTNFGQFVSDSPDNPYNSREIYVAHTNFDITEEHIKDIINVAGVEGFRPLTRYSFTIIIGVAFFYEDVLSEIERLLNVEKLDFDTGKTKEVLNDNEDLVKDALKKVSGKYWHIYIMPNGFNITEEYENEEKMIERHPFFLAMAHLSEGLLLTSQDKNDE